MANKEAFIQAVNQGYTFKGESVKIGCGVLDGEVIADAGINLPLKTLNRHGLIAGFINGFWFSACVGLGPIPGIHFQW